MPDIRARGERSCKPVLSDCKSTTAAAEGIEVLVRSTLTRSELKLICLPFGWTEITGKAWVEGAMTSSGSEEGASTAPAILMEPDSTRTVQEPASVIDWNRLHQPDQGHADEDVLLWPRDLSEVTHPV